MIRFINPCLPPPAEWLPYLQASYESRWFSNFGPAHERFAHCLSERYGGPRVAVPVANATVGLEAVLRALNVSGAVLLPSFTFAATGQAVLAAGATPLFCDVDPDTWELAPATVEAVLRTQRVGAVLAVRAFGLCRDFSALSALCRRYGVPLVIDSAAALGGDADGEPCIGRQGMAEVFSLHATKVFGIGEGGVVMCDEALAAALRVAINFGLADGDILCRGSNGKLSEFGAAVGLAMLGHLDRHIEQRRAYVARYLELLRPWLERGVVRSADRPGRAAYQTLPLLLSPSLCAQEVQQRCASAGLELRRYYRPALHGTRLFRRHAHHRPLPVTERLSLSMICLPVYSEMSDELIRTAADLFTSALDPIVPDQGSSHAHRRRELHVP